MFAAKSSSGVLLEPVRRRVELESPLLRESISRSSDGRIMTIASVATIPAVVGPITWLRVAVARPWLIDGNGDWNQAWTQVSSVGIEHLAEVVEPAASRTLRIAVVLVSPSDLVTTNLLALLTISHIM